MPRVPAVSPMYEDVHQQTGRQQQKRQNGKCMSPMLGHQIKARDGQKRDNGDLVAGPSGTGAGLGVRVVVHYSLRQVFSFKADGPARPVFLLTEPQPRRAVVDLDQCVRVVFRG